MTSASLNHCSLGEVPEDNMTRTVCRSQDLAVRAAFQGADEIGMAGESSDTLTRDKGPHADSLIGLVTGGEDIRAVGVPRDLIDAGVVANHQAKVGDMILGPNSDSLVMAAGGKVVTEWSPADIPDWANMSFINNQARPCFERPEADGTIGGG